jgi:hypothetical protein
MAPCPPEIKTEPERRLAAANSALYLFTPNSRIERRKGGWYVRWERKDKVFARRWSILRGNDFYPVWHRAWGRGGTSCKALSQLIRWLRGQPVFPIGTWRYWISDGIQLGPPQIVPILLGGGYPEKASCVLCTRVLGKSTGLDWWSLDDVSGPCCSITGGCQQTAKAAPAPPQS